jgi:uracil-DNA glycosylase
MENVNSKINESWKLELMDEFASEYFKKLKLLLVEEKKNFVVYPSGENIFAAFDKTPFEKVKVVILGQDPYHGANQAHGLSFSVQQGVPAPPSLKNIFKEIKSDIGCEIPNHGNLEKWANQGILMLNATLTVRANQAGSHQKKGWEQFTNAVIKKISDKKTGVIFLLWGNYAKEKETLIDTLKHIVLKAAHPSPLAGGAFFGCKHFSKTNEHLRKLGKTEIDWSL